MCCRVALDRELLVPVADWLRLPTAPIKNMISNQQVPFDHFHTLQESFLFGTGSFTSLVWLLPCVNMHTPRSVRARSGNIIKQVRFQFNARNLSGARQVSRNSTCSIHLIKCASAVRDLGTCLPQCISPWPAGAYFRVHRLCLTCLIHPEDVDTNDSKRISAFSVVRMYLSQR